MSILESIVKPAPTKQQPTKSILDSFGSPQKQRQVQQKTLIGSELNRLEQLQASVAHHMDLFPAKQEKVPGQVKQQQNRLQKLIQQSAGGPHKSILESNLFINREAERERMMKMYTNEELKEELEARQLQTPDRGQDCQISETSSINDRLVETQKQEQQQYQDPPTRQRAASNNKKRYHGNDATDSDSKARNVSFAANTKKGQAARQKLSELSQTAVNGGIEEIKAQLDEVRARTLEVQAGVNDGFAVEDSKLLEAVLEHILFYWDDIMACLVDELIEEEVLELNRIERIRSGEDPDREAREDLIDMLFEKKKTYHFDAPHLGFSCTREL